MALGASDATLCFDGDDAASWLLMAVRNIC